MRRIDLLTKEEIVKIIDDGFECENCPVRNKCNKDYTQCSKTIAHYFFEKVPESLDKRPKV